MAWGQYGGPAVAPPRRRQRHGWRTFGIVVLVLVILLVVADRVGDYVAERIAGDTIQQSQHLSSRPDVSVDDIPFLTQFATGDYGQVTVTAHDVQVGPTDHLVDIDALTVVLHDVHVSHSFSSVRADTADASATIGYPQLSKALGIDVAYASNGRIRVGDKVSILGQTIDASVTVSPKIVDGALAFGKPVINGAGQLAGSVVDALDKVFDLQLPLRNIPFDVSVQSLGVTSAGLQVRLTGSNLSYSS